MEIIFYTTNDSSNVINKTLDNPLTVNINLKKDTDIINPELILKGNFRGYNYAHIPALNRYYLVTAIEQLNLSIVKIRLMCDVLETYKDIILNSEASYNRGLKEGDLYDGNLDVSPKKTVRIVESSINVKANEPTIILTTMGAVA